MAEQLGAGGPLVGVLALQGDVREHRRMLEACGVATRAVRRPGELSGLDGIVLPGGESTTIAKLARRTSLLSPLSDAVRAGLPAFGTCAGMILLADCLADATGDQETVGGLDVVVRRNAFGRQVDSFEAEVELLHPADLPRRCRAVFIRAPQVEKLGAGVDPIARITTGPAAGRIVAVRQRHVLATSFHPEMTGVPVFHELFVSMVRA